MQTRELTVRAILLGGILTLMFTAANVYLGLRVGLTFATSIPAAVISMALLRAFANGTILENNIVQTVASAAGTLAAICFVLPGLVMIGAWNDFPFWTTALITFLGGFLGVMFSIPLRRALVVDAPLPYPEGVAAAEVLKVGASDNKAGLRIITTGALASAGFALLAAMRIAAAEAATFFRVGSGATGISAGLSFALLGAGHLVGISVGLAIGLGILIGWAGAVPILTSGIPGPAEEVALTVWREQVRFFGAGVIGVAAIWTLLSILGPILGGIRSAMAASSQRKAGEGTLPLQERDLPIGIVTGASLVVLALIGVLLAANIGEIENAPLVIGGSLVFVVVAGAFIAAVCGYMAGLIGASNSPISGIGILSIIGAALLIGAVAGGGDNGPLVVYALLVTAVVFGIATISNDNLQDLKTGQLVGATPWRQQVALVFGVFFGSLVIPPVLSLLNQAYGFAGAPGAGANALPAPQAALISALAKGVLGGTLDWRMIGYGAIAGVVIAALDRVLRKTRGKGCPPLAVGLGIYLPMQTSLLVVVGAVAGWFYDRRAKNSRDPEGHERMGVLLATGLIVGESLFGVALAALVVGTGSDAPLSVVPDSFGSISLIFAPVLFGLITVWLYRRAARAQ
ncbi:OPT family oligopeptide transporter [Sphingomonas sp.]|jgi:putative OPT family oligopeptide transporter|uniref:OPT family oligopeptide transporter n=1 Tax=Sphingomonas sp. TaxID=28214 RepID=UPI002DEB6D6A|nr:oligopeptide transporter, OPT family [Sphingomonas sp.]HEV2567188.1 oligopeptide transporter, OPT family [Sphingomonas sp.]